MNAEIGGTELYEHEIERRRFWGLPERLKPIGAGYYGDPDPFFGNLKQNEDPPNPYCFMCHWSSWGIGGIWGCSVGKTPDQKCWIEHR